MKNLAGRPFALLGVNVNGYSVKELKAAIEKEKLPWRTFADPDPLGKGAIASRWNLTATPTLYVIGHDGVIRNKWLGAPGEKALDAAVDRAIEEAEKAGK